MIESIDSMAKVLAALSDANRLRIVSLLLEYDLCVNALAGHLDISKSAVSQHLKLLRESGLVRGEKRGYFTHYSVQREGLEKLGKRLAAMAATPRKDHGPGPDCGGPIKKRMEK